jgi:hypothetical protein
MRWAMHDDKILNKSAVKSLIIQTPPLHYNIFGMKRVLPDQQGKVIVKFYWWPLIISLAL